MLVQYIIYTSISSAMLFIIHAALTNEPPYICTHKDMRCMDNWIVGWALDWELATWPAQTRTRRTRPMPCMESIDCQ
jgi:hypothetical protein